jgi:competence protein ComGC
MILSTTITCSAATLRRNKAGFTLIELLIFTAIIAVLIGLLMPALFQAKVIANKTEIGSRSVEISDGMLAYKAKNGAFPTSMTQLAQSDVWMSDLVLKDDALEHPTLNYKFTLAEVSNEKQEEQSTLSLASSAEQTASKQKSRFLIAAEPKEPYGDGSFVLLANEKKEVVDVGDDPAAVEDEKQRFAKVTKEALDTTEELLLKGDLDLTMDVLPYVKERATFDLVYDDLDGNGDKQLSSTEVKQFSLPKPGEEGEPIEKVRALVKKSLETLRLDNGPEVSVKKSDFLVDPDDPASPLKVDAAALFSPAGICEYIDGSVANAGVATSLCAKVKAAEAAHLRGDDEACREIVEALEDEIWAQVGKNLTENDAEVLGRLLSLLCPEPLDELD